jgi:Tfp pilus assembly protein PilO
MKKSLLSVIGLGLGLAALAVGYFYTYAQWQNLDSANAELAVVETENEKLKEAQAQVSAFLAQYNRSQTEAQKADRTLPMGKPGVPELLGNFDEMAKASGLVLETFNLIDVNNAPAEGTSAPNAIKPLDFQVELTGTYESFKDLLLRTQNNLRLMDLVSMSLDNNTEVGGNGNSLKFILRFRAYYQE